MREIDWRLRLHKLEDKDVCQGRLDGPNGTHCMGGWLRVLFGETWYDTPACESLVNFLKLDVIWWNDGAEKERIAPAWNDWVDKVQKEAKDEARGVGT